MNGAARVPAIMEAFARSTGLTSDAAPRRYLWTDAFAVCNYLGLHEATGEARWRQLALLLVEQVHGVLGRHRPDDARRGWVSGLSAEEGERHPTAGGLRIGKKQPERAPGEPLDARREWDRDGQYYHYLTRWMHALNRAFRVTGREAYHRWAVELARAAHGAFVYRAGGEPRMYWKMSIDLSRPLVPSMGSHDPLDGFVTLCALRAAAPEDRRPLEEEIAALAAMCRGRRWTTEDPLGIGGMLTDAYRLARLRASGRLDDQPGGRRAGQLLGPLLDDSLASLRVLARTRSPGEPAEQRLAFRELGLAIGLAAVERMGRRQSGGAEEGLAEGGERLDALRAHLPAKDEILRFWTDPGHRRARTWNEHLDINRVMLATALAPDGHLEP